MTRAVAIGALLLALGCATADVATDGSMRLTARGQSEAVVCPKGVTLPASPTVGDLLAAGCVAVKGGAISQVFGNLLSKPFDLAAGILGGAAKGAADAAEANP